MAEDGVGTAAGQMGAMQGAAALQQLSGLGGHLFQGGGPPHASAIAQSLGHLMAGAALMNQVLLPLFRL